jgi:N-formylmaleamate deformylase
MEVQCTGGNVHVNGIRIHFLRFRPQHGIEQGRETLIVVPGITSPAITWDFVGKRFGRNFDTYVLDVRGRGLSSASDELDYSLDAQARDLMSFASEIGLQHFSAIGHSMGARIVARAASLRPAGLCSIVLIDPPVSGPGRRDYPANLSWYIDSIRLANLGCGREELRRFCPSWSDEQLDLRAEWLHTCDIRAVIESYNGVGFYQAFDDFLGVHI